MKKEIRSGKGLASIDFGTASDDSVVALTALIRHLARTAAENDYKTFLNTGQIPYAGNSPERSRP